MTIQSTTKICYEGRWYEIIDSENVILFDPISWDIRCDTRSTANWNGYVCGYSIKDDDIYLTSFSMNGTKPNQDLAYLNFLMIDSSEYPVSVEILKSDDAEISFNLLIRSDQFFNESESDKIQNAFLIGRNRRKARELTAQRDDFPWYYKEVHLVKTRNGRLFSVSDYSSEFYQFLRLFTKNCILEEKYRAAGLKFLTENLGVDFDRNFHIIG